jgi:hypothetical protein
VWKNWRRAWAACPRKALNGWGIPPEIDHPAPDFPSIRAWGVHVRLSKLPYPSPPATSTTQEEDRLPRPRDANLPALPCQIQTLVTPAGIGPSSFSALTQIRTVSIRFSFVRRASPAYQARKKDRYCFHNISPRNSISRLGRLSFLDHISIPCLVYLQPVLGLHVGIGPSSAVSGVATTPYTQAKPSIRTTILTARFMDCFSLSADPLGAGTLTRTNYTAICQQTAHSGNRGHGAGGIGEGAGVAIRYPA